MNLYFIIIIFMVYPYQSKWLCDEFLISNHVLASLSLVYALIDLILILNLPLVLLSKIINNDTWNTYPAEMLQWGVLSVRLRIE